MISIIIPAYNEEHRISKTIHSIYKEFKNIEVLVVSNGSTDNTCQVVKELAKTYPNLNLYEYKEKLGKGGALAKGFQFARGDVIGFIDADDSFDMKGVHYLVNLLEKYDCSMASKWKGKKFSEVDEPPLRKVLSRCWNLLLRILFNLQFTETQAGAKFLKREVYQKINKNFICTGFEFDAELLFRIKQKKFRIIEVHIPHKHVEESTFSTKYIWQMFKNIIKLRFKAWFEKKSVADYYDTKAKDYQKRFSTGKLAKIRKKERSAVWELLEPKKEDIILDAGCGSGFDAIPLLEQGCKVFGFDISSGMVEEAKTRGLKAQVADIENFLLNKTFNKIVSLGTFEFCKRHKKILDNFYKHLNTGGICVILFPRRTLTGLLYKAYHRVFSNINIQLFTKKQFIILSKQAGFKVTAYKEPHGFTSVIKLEKSTTAWRSERKRNDEQ